MTELMPRQYTLDDLEAALAERSEVERRWSEYSGNNPNKFHSERHDAHMRVLRIEGELKRAGVIPYSGEELLAHELDRLYPDAPSRSIVEHGARRYQIRYLPNGLSRAGNVKGGYSHVWRELTPEQVEVERQKEVRRRRRKEA